MGYLTEFIHRISKKSQLVNHQILWNMNTNMYLDEDMQHKDREYIIWRQSFFNVFFVVLLYKIYLPKITNYLLIFKVFLKIN